MAGVDSWGGSGNRSQLQIFSDQTRRSQFVKRVVVFAAIGPATLRVVRAGPPFLTALAAIGGGIAGGELRNLVDPQASRVDKWKSMAATLVLVGAKPGGVPAAVIILAARPPSLSATYPTYIRPLLVSATIGIPLRLGISLRGQDIDGANWLGWTMATSWLADLCAYVLGPHMPPPHLPKSINPSKKWLGYVPGIIASTVSGWLSAESLLGLSKSKGALVGLGLGVSAAAGDMLESSVKRSAGVRDAGSMLPGYGGLLDRIDSLLAATTAVWVLRRWARES